MEHASRPTPVIRPEDLAVRLAWVASSVFFALVLAAIFGFFNSILVVGVLGIGGILSLSLLIPMVRRIRFRSFATIGLIAGGLFCIGIVVFFHDFSLGRDDMGYLVSAQRLIETGNLAWEDVLSRPLHSVRQISGDVFTSQFLPLYPALLAVPMMRFGVEHVGMVNALLWGLGLLMIFFVGRRLSNRQDALAGALGVLAVATFYTSFWFSHRVNSENILFFLFWFGVLLVLRGVQEHRPVEILLALFPISLALLARGEALVLLVGWLAIGLFLVIRKKLRVPLDSRTLLAGLFALTPVAALGIYAARYQAVYFLDQVKAMLTVFELVQRPVVLVLGLIGLGILLFVFSRLPKKSDQRRIAILLGVGLLVFELLVFGLAFVNRLPWSVFRIQFVMETWLWYFLFPWIGLLWWAAMQRRLSLAVGLLAGLALPLGILILQPNIALDQPWFMRRFFSVLVPFFLLTGAVSLTSLFSGKRLARAAMGLLLLNLLIAAPVIAFQEHRGVSQQLQGWASEFRPGDLVLMRPGWGWQKWALPLATFEGVSVLPNDDVVRDEVFVQELPSLLSKYPKWETVDQELLGIMNTLFERRAEELRKIIAPYERVFVITDTQSRVHPYYEERQLTFLHPLQLKLAELSDSSRVTGYVRQVEDQIPLFDLRDRIGSMPPRGRENNIQTYYLYRVNDPSKLLIQRGITVDQVKSGEIKEEPGVAAQVLAPQDLEAMRRWVAKLKKTF